MGKSSATSKAKTALFVLVLFLETALATATLILVPESIKSNCLAVLEIDIGAAAVGIDVVAVVRGFIDALGDLGCFYPEMGSVSSMMPCPDFHCTSKLSCLPRSRS